MCYWFDGVEYVGFEEYGCHVDCVVFGYYWVFDRFYDYVAGVGVWVVVW